MSVQYNNQMIPIAPPGAASSTISSTPPNLDHEEKVNNNIQPLKLMSDK